MEKGVIADLVAFVIDARGDGREPVRLVSDQKESRRRVFALKDIENLRRPLRVRPVIKGDCDLIRAGSVSAHSIRLRKRIYSFITDQIVRVIQSDGTRAVCRRRFKVQYLAIPFHIDVLPGLNLSKLTESRNVKRIVPDLPQRAVLRAKPP